MNLHEVLVAARKENKAICRPSWEDQFIYHGMDNMLRWNRDKRSFDPAVADLLHTDYELFQDASYHGPLADKLEN